MSSCGKLILSYSITNFRLTMSTLMVTTYGYKVKSADDAYLGLIERVMKMTVEAGSHGATIVDFFPIRKRNTISCNEPLTVLFSVAKMPAWVPGAGFKRHALKTKKLVRELLDRPFNSVRQQMVRP